MIMLQKEVPVVIEYQLEKPLENGQETMTMQSTSPIMLEGGECVRHYGDSQVYKVDGGKEYFNNINGIETVFYHHQAVKVSWLIVWLKMFFNRRFQVIRLGS